MFGAWGAGGRVVAEERECSRKTRWGEGSGAVWEEEGEVFLSSRSFPWEPVEHRVGDNRRTGWAAPLSFSRAHSSVSLGSVCAAISLMTLAPLIWSQLGNWSHCSQPLDTKKNNSLMHPSVIKQTYQQFDA